MYNLALVPYSFKDTNINTMRKTEIINTIQWTSGPCSPQLLVDTIQVWRIILPLPSTDTLNGLQDYLSREECLGVEKLRFDADKQRFLIARAALRDILARYLQKTPNNIHFQYNDYGKPYLQCQSLHFNVSHSLNCILYAVSKTNPVGIDVEHCAKNIEYLSVAKQFFQKTEYRKLLDLPEKERVLYFYRCWTRKEAILKAMGTGLSFPLNVSELGWELQEINPAQDYIATVATAQKYQRLFLWDWSPNLRDNQRILQLS